MSIFCRAYYGTSTRAMLCRPLMVSALAGLLAACTSSNIDDVSEGLSLQAKAPPPPVQEKQVTGLLPSGVIDGRAGKIIDPLPTHSTSATSSAQNIKLQSEQTAVASTPDSPDSPSDYSIPLPPVNLAEQRIEKLYTSFKHGKCQSGWGKQADKLDALRYSPGDPYYIEIRMRHTPPLLVGHTYTAYGRLDKNGNKLDEHLVMLAPKGGYAGATVAAAVPMASNMEPTKADCTIKPVAAYRVSLTAEKYEKLLEAVKAAKAEKPRYGLWTQNCNHMTSRLSESVGIKAPRNRYTTSLVYMYDIMRENEGANYKPSGKMRREIASKPRQKTARRF